MRDKFFLDTNILIYSFDQTEGDKQKIAQNLIADALTGSNGIISHRVIQEFLNAATRKFKSPLSISDCQNYLHIVLEPLCSVFSDFELYYHALDIMERWQYSFYDSLIIAAAIKGTCTILYSEDFQHKQKIQDLTILNPFLSKES